MAWNLRRVGFVGLIYVIMTVSASAQSSKLNGYWAGLWRDGGTTAIAVSIHIRGDTVVEYIWDGRLVTGVKSRFADETLAVTGPGLNVTIRWDGKNRLKAVAADNTWPSTLARTSKDAWKRKPYTFSDDYGGTPKKSGANPKLSSVHLDLKCCFVSERREAPHAGMNSLRAGIRPQLRPPDGTVSRFYSAENSYGCGNGITIKHRSELYSRYCHLGAVANLRKGQLIKPGDVVGTVGSSGTAPRRMPHIHYELTRDGDPHDDGDTGATVDPMPYFVECLGSALLGTQKLELTYPILCSRKTYKLR